MRNKEQGMHELFEDLVLSLDFLLVVWGFFHCSDALSPGRDEVRYPLLVFLRKLLEGVACNQVILPILPILIFIGLIMHLIHCSLVRGSHGKLVNTIKFINNYILHINLSL